MNLLNFLFAIISCSGDKIFIKKILLLQNNFWKENRLQVRTKEGLLSNVLVKSMDFESFHIGDLCMPNTSHFDYTNGKFLSVIGPDLTKKVLSKLDKKEQVYLKFHYTFINCQLNSINEQKRECNYDNYKILSKGTGDTIKMEGDGPSIYLYHIKLILQRIFTFKFMKLEDYELIFNGSFTVKTPKFTLYYFKSLTLCHKNFKTFVKFLNLLKCDKYDRINGVFHNNHLRISYFKKYFQKEFVEYKNTKDKSLHPMIEFIFKEFCVEIIKQMTSNNVPMPIKGNLTVEYYFDKLFNLIKETIDCLIDDLDKVTCSKVQDTFDKHFEKFKQDIQQIDKLIFDDIWKSINVLEYFSILLGKDILCVEDYKEAERVICDFHNMMRCCFEIKHYFNNNCEFCLVEPIKNDEFECQIIRAFEITIMDPVKLGSITALSSEGREITMIRNLDFFVRIQKNYEISITFKKIREKNIHDIEVVSADGKHKESFIVNDYLDIDEKQTLDKNCHVFSDLEHLK